MTDVILPERPIRRRPLDELPQDLLDRFRARADAHDADNTFCADDVAELVELGYLTALLPVHLGGWGWDLGQLAGSQRRLARYAPATALCTTMHFYWTGIVAAYEGSGDTSLRWLAESVADGDIVAAGHAEAGNDIPVLLSTSVAQPVEGGYRITGRKQFGSNGPVWRWLGVHAMDGSDPQHPQIVHAFVERTSPGVTVVETWDTLGMRATQSHDTILDGVFVPDDRVGAVLPALAADHPFLAAMNVFALSLIASVYLGIGDRALEVAVASAKKKTSIAIERGAYAYNPMVQHQIAAMYLELDAASATVDRYIEDILQGVDHGALAGARLFSAKWRAVEAVKRVVDVALDVSGGGGMFKGNELERLYRDARCGGFHPGNDALTHEMVAKDVLGIAEEPQRW
jgi:alkylation response protein AidB-like acyl-CoA dehydrogenase